MKRGKVLNKALGAILVSLLMVTTVVALFPTDVSARDTILPASVLMSPSSPEPVPAPGLLRETLPAAAALPDLAVVSLDISAHWIMPGFIINISWDVENQSNVPSGSFHNRISLQNYTTDIELGVFPMGPFAAWGESSDAQAVQIPESVSPGRYYLVLYADCNNEVAESCENNKYFDEIMIVLTLTLYVREGSDTGPPLPGVQVTGTDGDDNSFDETTNAEGYVVITGAPGEWKFYATKDGYAPRWGQEYVSETSTKDTYLVKPVTVKFYVKEESEDWATAPVLPGARVIAKDGLNNYFDQTTNAEGYVVFTGAPGDWYFDVGKLGYDSHGFWMSINEDCTTGTFLYWSTVTLTLYVHEASDWPYGGDDPQLVTPVIPGAQVSGTDGAGKPFNLTTNAEGYVVISGEQGQWELTIAKEGYGYLTEEFWVWRGATVKHFPLFKPVTLTLYVHDDTGKLLSGARVMGSDGAWQPFDLVTDGGGRVVISGWSGVWTCSIYYYDEDLLVIYGWSGSILETCTRYIYPPVSYNLSIGVDGNGTTYPAPGYYWYPWDSVVDITATPAHGWYFNGWGSWGCVVADPSSPATTVTMPSSPGAGGQLVEASFKLMTYTLNLAATEGGSTLPLAGDYSYLFEAWVTITAVPNIGWRFANWTGDVADPTSAVTTVFMDDNKTVTANFAQETILAIDVSPLGGGTTNPHPGVHTCTAGTPVTVIAFPNQGYRFKEWSGDVSGTDNPLTITMDTDKSITANFSAIFPPRVTTGAPTNITDNSATLNGNLGSLGTASSVDVFFEWGPTWPCTNMTTPQTMTSTGAFSFDLTGLSPGITYYFLAEAVGDFTSYGVDKSFNTVARYTLTLAVNGNGTTTPSVGTHTYVEGTEVTITALASPGYRFKEWSDNASGTANPVTITMDGNKTVTANFIRQYTLTIGASPSGGGNTDPTPGTYAYDEGAQVTITATPSVGWQFSNWSGGVAAPNSATTTVTMDSNKTITANFTQGYTLTMAVNGSGSTTPAVGSYAYPAGTVVNISATPASGWQFVNWTGDVANPGSPTTTVTMNANKTVTANFTQIPITDTFTLTMAVNGNGTTSPAAGVHSYPTGTPVNVTASLSSGWQFSHWSGDASGTANPITITMDSDKVVTANFAPVGITLIGAIKQNPVVYEGQTVTISGEYRGWEGGHGSPPVTRSDWVVQDNTGSIYITGSSLGLRYPDDLGKVIKVNGIVKLKNGQPYIYIARNSPVEGFTEFYILPSGSGDFPREVTLGESGKVIVGIVNHEHEVAVYKVEIVIDAEKVGEMAPVTLIDGEKFEQEADFTPIRAGLNQKVEFLLYEGATTEPYLKLYLFVDVKEAP